MNRVMTGVRLELTTYGLKERRVPTTNGNQSSDSGALRRPVATSQAPESLPNGVQMCDEMRRGSTHCCGAYNRDSCLCLRGR